MQTVSQKESNSLSYQTDDLDLAAPLEPEHIPLSFAQQRLWFFSQLEPDSALYNVPVAFRLRGALHLEVLQQSLNAIVDRHEALRTNFVSNAGTPAQVIRTSATVRISCFDLSAEPAAQRDQTAQHLLKAEAHKSFDLSTDLLFSASLIQLGLQEHLLLLNMHHIVSDEWSLRILFRELQFFYTKFLNEAPTFLAELPIQYADFALWQREYLQGGLINDDLEYWKNKLGNDSSSTELRADHPRPAVQTYRGGSVSIALPKAIANRVNEFRRSEGVTLFTTLLTAFKTLLHRYTGQDQVTVGSPISGRNKIETESLIGFFVNTLVLRTTVSGETSFRKLLAKVREVTLGAYAHQELPFEKLVERLAPQRTSGQVSYIQVVFALQNVSDTNLHLPGLDSEFLEVESNTAKFDLTFVVRETREGITLAAEYNSDLFESGTIQRMLCHYGRLLELVIDNPNQSISGLDFLEDTERSQLLIDWNNTKTIYPSDKCIPELFAAQVKRAPESVAVVYGEHQLTYRELDERSNQLAHSLRKAGVGPDVLVGICVGRSVEMVVGLLGILKAGGAYLPLDADYPSERIAFMLDDAKSSILLTQKSLLLRLQTHTCKIFCLDSDWEIVSREPTTAPAINTKPENLAY
ncbi:MAG: condensation domain-containing protein, partial [Verrucomicrobiota bacterium]